MILNSRTFIFLILTTFNVSFLKAQVSVEIDTVEKILFNNASFEGDNGASKYPDSWEGCSAQDKANLPDVQPGSFGVQLVPFNGKNYLSLVSNDDGSVESIRQPLSTPLKAGKCYRFSVYLAKSEKYENQSRLQSNLVLYDKPIKLIVWGVSGDSCVLSPDDWLTETKPIHHNRWKKYVFYIQPPKDCQSVVLQVACVGDKPYNGNILMDNISPLMVVPCSDLKLSEGTVPSSKRAILLIQLLNEIILNNAAQLKFDSKKIHFVYDGYSKAVAVSSKSANLVRNEYFDRMLEVFEKYDNYKLVIRVKNKDKLAKERVVYLYNYIFKHSRLKAQQIDIQKFKPKDEEYIWSFENDELAISFDNL